MLTDREVVATELQCGVDSTPPIETEGQVQRELSKSCDKDVSNLRHRKAVRSSLESDRGIPGQCRGCMQCFFWIFSPVDIFKNMGIQAGQNRGPHQSGLQKVKRFHCPPGVQGSAMLPL
jgi:hypothetical protein